MNRRAASPAASPQGPAQCGDAQDCIELGLADFNGSGDMPRNHTMFLSAFDRSCELGNGGEGAPRDNAKAREYDELACATRLAASYFAPAR